MRHNGFFINLDRSPERRAKMEAQLAQHGLQDIYRRFAATDGNALGFPNPSLRPGEMGVFTSHYLLLKENLGATQPLHIIEDDILLANCLGTAMQWVMDKEFLEKYDVIYTDTQIPTSNVYYRTYKKLFDEITTRDATGRVTQANFHMLDLHDRKFGTASSLIVSPKAIAKLHDLYAAELTRGPAAALDIFMWQKVMDGTLTAACTFPFVTSLRLEHSLDTSITARYEQLSVLARDLVRASFFIDRDLDACRRYFDQYLKGPDDPHNDILAHLLGLTLY